MGMALFLTQMAIFCSSKSRCLKVTQIILDFASPPDREKAVIQLMIGNEQIAEVNHESESVVVEIYGKRDGQPWVVDLNELSAALAQAKERLIGTRP